VHPGYGYIVWTSGMLLFLFLTVESSAMIILHKLTVTGSGSEQPWISGSCWHESATSVINFIID
jgi:hypothetical protein